MEKTTFNRIMFAVCLLFLFLVARYTGITEYVSLEYINQNREYISQFITDYYLLSILLFIGINAVCVSLALPVSVIFNIASGYFFGLIPGVLYSNIGSTLGAFTAFSVCRYVLKDAMMVRYGDRLKKFNQRFAQEGIGYLLFLQLLPITPYGLIIILGALSDISAVTFVLTTFFGITPGALIYAYAGKELATITSAGDILSWPVIIALTLLAALALLPTIIKRIRGDKKIHTNQS